MRVPVNICSLRSEMPMVDIFDTCTLMSRRPLAAVKGPRGIRTMSQKPESESGIAKTAHCPSFLLDSTRAINQVTDESNDSI
ncbi:uncharacterized protein MELLADRAFT_87960 [Melampsora larici-populina 98AG31]|uniref:Uncharacterized protein n=1 Tax=Melampsora larici-populina (strain 98AG31 / pathotype 3-4-7) TaxID=747676 RepID=F4RQJ2_MELLP|nr:uncharacterized protein MELLADRAFT_87960 [Melampsora larici-populina 98AG31]EGG05504.1 hypothetical protein MELLADRAFT_87960 [Melampsora larici-populina 98AG31]